MANGLRQRKFDGHFRLDFNWGVARQGCFLFSLQLGNLLIYTFILESWILFFWHALALISGRKLSRPHTFLFESSSYVFNIFSTWCTWIANSVLTARLRATGSQKALILLERVPDLAVTGAQVAEWIEEVCDQILLNLLNVHQGNVKKQKRFFFGGNYYFFILGIIFCFPFCLGCFLL